MEHHQLDCRNRLAEGYASETLSCCRSKALFAAATRAYRRDRAQAVEPRPDCRPFLRHPGGSLPRECPKCEDDDQGAAGHRAGRRADGARHDSTARRPLGEGIGDRGLRGVVRGVSPEQATQARLRWHRDYQPDIWRYHRHSDRVSSNVERLFNCQSHTSTTRYAVSGTDGVSFVWQDTVQSGVPRVTWQSATGPGVVLRQLNGPRPPQAALTALQTCPSDDSTGHGRSADAMVVEPAVSSR
jgi:hypothetical protein